MNRIAPRRQPPRTVRSMRRWNGAKQTGAKNFSQITNTGKSKPPRMIITMM